MKTDTRTAFLAALAAVLILAPGIRGAAAGSVVVDRVVAVVNDDVITMSDLQRELARSAEVRDERLMLEEMIDRKLQMVAAKKNGMEVTDRDLNDAIDEIMKRNRLDKPQLESALAREGLTMEQYRSDLREQMTLSRLFNKYVRTEIVIDDADVRAYYEANAAQYSLPEEVRVRHLLIPLSENASASEVEAAKVKAADLKARIKKGEDLVTLIRQNSGSPSRAQDGDLGFLQRGQTLPEIEAAVKDLKAGDYVGPVRCSDGFHILRVEEVRVPKRPFEKVKDEISKMLYEQKVSVKYRTWLQTLRSDSHIENRL